MGLEGGTYWALLSKPFCMGFVSFSWPLGIWEGRGELVELYMDPSAALGAALDLEWEMP
jgi:hypothetical protein